MQDEQSWKGEQRTQTLNVRLFSLKNVCFMNFLPHQGKVFKCSLKFCSQAVIRTTSDEIFTTLKSIYPRLPNNKFHSFTLRRRLYNIICSERDLEASSSDSSFQQERELGKPSPNVPSNCIVILLCHLCDNSSSQLSNINVLRHQTFKRPFPTNWGPFST